MPFFLNLPCSLRPFPLFTTFMSFLSFPTITTALISPTSSVLPSHIISPYHLHLKDTV